MVECIGSRRFVSLYSRAIFEGQRDRTVRVKSMAAKTAAATLIAAALALVWDYSTVQPGHNAYVSAESAAVQQKISKLKRILADLRKDWTILDESYAEVVRVTLKREKFDSDLFAKLPGLISSTRALEAALKTAIPPQDLAEDHMALRRAVAKTRGHLVTLESLFRQATQDPEYFESDIDMEGLIALANHSTRRLAGLA